jgi:nickel-dependent lactate racemase
MKVDLLYGRNGISVDLPPEARATVIRKHPMIPLEDPVAAVKQAIAAPVQSDPLSKLGRDKQKVCILVCDVTRPVPNGTVLPPLLEALAAAGISQENILILVATGLHRPNEGEELREIIGSDEIYNSIRIENHLARDREAHVELGKTSTGTPIAVDRRFVEADLKIVTGLVEPHFMAGYSGGRKVVIPGVASQDTILKLHAAQILEHCRAVNCVIEGNPLHNEQMEIVQALGGILALNVVIDEARRIGFVNFGEVETSHLEAVAFMRKYAEVRIPRRFKTIVTTSAGYPLDKTYYQTIKGMVGVLEVLEPGGTIIIASECAEGMGSREFVEAQRLLCRLGPERFLATLQAREQARIDEWQTEMLVKALKVGRVQLYTTGLEAEALKDTFVEPVASVAEAVRASMQAQGDNDIAVVPEGPYVIPLFDDTLTV